MKRFNAKQLHENPAKIYTEAHREPVEIEHKNHGVFVLLSPVQILSKHTHLDGTVSLNLRSFEARPMKKETDGELMA